MLLLTEKEMKDVVLKGKDTDSLKVKDFAASIIESSHLTCKEVSKGDLSISKGDLSISKLPMNEAELNWYCSMSREELEKIDRKR